MLYFIAIVAPPPVNAQVLTWKKYMEREYGCQVALRSPAHITLVPPFKMSIENKESLKDHLQKFSSTRSTFHITLKDFDSFAPRVIFLHVEPSPPLLDLKSQLDEYLITIGRFPIKKEDRAFHPHVTIANRDLTKQDFSKAWAYFQEIKYEVGFSAQALSLLRHTNGVWEIEENFLFK